MPSARSLESLWHSCMVRVERWRTYDDKSLEGSRYHGVHFIPVIPGMKLRSKTSRFAPKLANFANPGSLMKPQKLSDNLVREVHTVAKIKRPSSPICSPSDESQPE